MITRKDLMIGDRFIIYEENMETSTVIITKIAGKTVEVINKNKETKQIPIQDLHEIQLKPGELGFSRRSMKINGQQINDWVKEIINPDTEENFICVFRDDGVLTIENNIIYGITTVHKYQNIIRCLYGIDE